MNPQSDITDDEFVPFLNSLGVETYNKSFEWMLNDPDSAGVLRWLYNSLDQTNALTAREEYRYAEIQKKGKLLSPEDLEAAISALRAEHPGLVLPGNQEAVEDQELDIGFQRERLSALETQEEKINDLIRQNELAKENLVCRETNLHATHKQYQEDEKTASKECLSLAQEIEDLTEGVMNVITEMLDLYSNCHLDKATAEKFVTFGPFEAYRQSQALFQSHFDLFTSSKLAKRPTDGADSEAEVLAEAYSMEESLSDAITEYISTKVELSGEQAKLTLVANYEDVHPSQIAFASLEAQSAIEVLSQEESILEQQVSGAAAEFVRARTREVDRVALSKALRVRERILSSLAHLHSLSSRALSCSLVLYRRARSELESAHALQQFAADMRAHYECTRAEHRGRIESMNVITAEHQRVSQQLLTSDPLLHTLHSLLAPDGSGGVALVRARAAVREGLQCARGTRIDGVKEREESLEQFKRSQAPLIAYLFDGCTKQPNCQQRTVSALTHALKRDIDSTDRKVKEASRMFTRVKSADKQHLRKLWQWFLADQGKLIAVMKETQSKSPTADEYKLSNF